MRKIRISVAMVTYNGEKYLNQQMDSILQNLGDTDEVVVSDDGSVDGTLSILEEYQKRDVRVKILSGPGQGIIANVEHALRACRGDYIYLSDQDDVWSANKVARIQQVFQETGTHLIVHDNEMCSGDLKQVLAKSFFSFRGCKSGVFANIVKNSYIGCCMAFRKELLEKSFPIPRQIQMHDQWLGLINDLEFRDTIFLPECLMRYRRHGENASDFQRNSVFCMIRNRIVLLKCLRNRAR